MKFIFRGFLFILFAFSITCFSQQREVKVPLSTEAEKKMSFKDIPNLKEVYTSVNPRKRNDGISVGELRVSKRDKNLIITVSQKIFDGKFGNYDALLISHKNKLVYESYYKKGRIDLPHRQASAAKGYTSLVLGRAIQMGYLSMDDLNKPLIHFLKDLNPKKLANGAENITLHKALTMQGGLTINRDEWKEIEKDTTRIEGQGLIQTLLEHSAPITSETQTYLYGNFNPMMVMTVIDAVVPNGAENFIKHEMLDKLGIIDYTWNKNPNGLPEAGWGVSMMSRDMIKLGNLVLNKGKFNGEQLISTDYLSKATSGIVNPTQDWMPKEYRYGYFWYQTQVKVADKSYEVSFAWGGGGQRVIVIEALDLTIVISGHDGDDDKIMTQISEIVIPAFIKDVSPIIKNRYFGEKPPGLTPVIFAPGIISIDGRYEHGISFSPDLDEVYFSANRKNEEPSIYYSKLENKKWVTPKKANFTKGEKVAEMHPFVSPNGKTLHFIAHDSFTLPHHKESVKSWYVKRLGNSWSEAKQLDSPINDDFVFYSNEAKNGDLYYTNVSKRKMYYAPKKEDNYPEVHELGTAGFHGFISPSQDYLVVNARNKEDDQRKSDIYVYFKKKDGTWSKPINLGNEVNSNFAETCPSITPDGKYLFFGRYNEKGGLSNFYWVSTEIISTLKTAYFKESK